MACGCKGRSGPLPQTTHASAPVVTAKRVAVYEVSKGGETLLSTTSPTAARAEARRLGASVKVSSRPVNLKEQQELTG